MSNNVKIQADDVTIVAGEKVKDYNVILTSEDDMPLVDFPVTIAFYNNEYTFEKEVFTNEYGVASTPLALGGDSWFVDVHFKGLYGYKPQLVTREITIDKFEILNSYISSENLVINVDEVSMEGTYYTIHLLDTYDRPMVNEPVSIIVRQTGVDDPETYIDMILNTDDEGIIKVPFLSAGENVEIITEYYGCVRYKPCINADIVTFEEVNPRNKFELRFNVNYKLEYRIGNGSWQLFPEENYIYISPYLNKEDNIHLSYYGWDYINYLNEGTDYKVTLCFEGGNSEYSEYGPTYPFCRTFSYESLTDTRKELDEWIEIQGGSGEVNVDISSTNYGDLVHVRLEFDYELPNQLTFLTVYGGMSSETFPKYEWSDVSWNRKTILEYDIVLFTYLTDQQMNFKIYQGENPFIIKNGSANFDYYTHYLDTEGSGYYIELEQTGFGANSETYQSIDVVAKDSYNTYYQKINDYYIMKLLNRDTFEEFYFYSYLIDDVTPVHNEFELALGNWRCIIVSKETEGWTGGYCSAIATITTPTEIELPTNTIMVQGENYIDLGSDTPSFVDGTISTTTDDEDIHSIMALEFTNSNYYKLSFNQAFTGNSNEGDSTVIYGADPSLETKDGLFIGPNSITLYNDDIEVDNVIFEAPFIPQTNRVILIQKYGTTVTVFWNDNKVYQTDLLSWNTIGLYQTKTDSAMTLSTFALEPYVATDITPSVADYDGTVFGSNIHLELKDNQLDFVDYGMLPQGSIGGGKVILNDVPLQNANEYAIQLEMRYNNTRFERLNNLAGEMQMRVFEDISTSDSVKDYAKTLCSPMPVPNSKTVFTRHTDEGTLYFVKDPLDANSSFLSNAYNQYKGGVEIISETGVSLFNLDNAYSPVFVGNELVRAEFHRRSGFIRLARYDENTGNWVNVNTLKLKNYPKLSLNEYNDDYAEIAFGNTTWKFYRGRPFIIVNHSQDELRIMDLVDRVYCETIENQRGMGYIMDYDPNEITVATDESGVVVGSYSTFNPQLSIQQFKQELHIGENIRLDNFEIYEGTSNKDIGDIANNSAMGILNIDNDNALQIFKDDTNLALNFPSYSHYVERINNTFTLSIGYIDCPFENITIKARGFDERGAVPVKDGVQYGIWEQIVNVTVDTTAPDSIRATFTGCPSEVKYIDFLIFFEGENSTDVILKDFMYYEGDAVINYDVDTSRVYAEQVEVHFADTYFANLYNDKDSGGLCIARPYQEPFSLRSIYASNETVLIPYMKKCSQWDKPEQVFLEYLNANRQIIDIDWEN